MGATEDAAARSVIAGQKPEGIAGTVTRVTSLKERYTVGARSLATQSMGGLARSRVTPDALTNASRSASTSRLVEIGP